MILLPRYPKLAGGVPTEVAVDAWETRPWAQEQAAEARQRLAMYERIRLGLPVMGRRRVYRKHAMLSQFQQGGFGRIQQSAVAGATDPFWANVTLLILGNGTPGTSTFTDSSSLANTITTNGSPQNSTTQSIEGGSSVFFNSGGLEVASGLATAWNFGAGDFAIELWRYGASGGSDRHMFDAWSSRFLARHSGSDVQFFTNFASPLLTYSQAWPTSGWNHYAWGRSGNSWGAWYDGVSKVTTTNASAISSTAIRLRISSSNAGETVPGYGDGIRITKAARYTPGVNFTPPTTFPTS